MVRYSNFWVIIGFYILPGTDEIRGCSPKNMPRSTPLHANKTTKKCIQFLNIRKTVPTEMLLIVLSSSSKGFQISNISYLFIKYSGITHMFLIICSVSSVSNYPCFSTRGFHQSLEGYRSLWWPRSYYMSWC
jgi:hypothetical protein